MSYRITCPTGHLKGRIRPVTSKSISNRLLILQAFSPERFHIRDLSTAMDTQELQKALELPASIVQAGEGGTTYRFLTAYLAMIDGEWELYGKGRMSQRPVEPLVRALQHLGADIQYLDQKEFPPLKIKGGLLKGGKVVVESSISSQFASALCLIAPFMPEGLELELKDVSSRSYLSMTLSLLRQCGIVVHEKGRFIQIPAQPLKETTFTVEADWSAVAPFYTMVAFSDTAEIELEGLKESTLQGDQMIASFMKSLGVETFFGKESALLLNAPSRPEELEWDLNNNPDLVMSLAVTCAGHGIQAAFSGIEHLKYKESDRLDALKKELGNINCRFQKVKEDWKLLPGKLPLSSEVITYHDHRMAMAFSPLALKMDQIILHEPEVVGKSYPYFWEDLCTLGFDIRESGS